MSPYTIPLYCPTCGQKMAVTVHLPISLASGLPATKKPIRCPYDGCTGLIEPVITSDVVSVVAAYPPDEIRKRA